MNIILFGQMGAGKTTIAKILFEKYNYLKFSLGGKIHSECAFHGKESREEMQRYGQMMREIFGEDVWNQWLFNKIHNFPTNNSLIEEGLVVIEDGRQLNEYDYWKHKGFICIGVVATDEQRIERIEKRTGKRPTLAQLTHDTEKQAEICTKKCQHVIYNVDTIEVLDLTVQAFTNIILGGKKI